MAEQLPLDFADAPKPRRRGPAANCSTTGGRRPKRKGSANERRVATIFRSIWADAHRGDQRSPYFRCPDVDGTPLWIEAKAGKRVNLHGAWKQAAEDHAKRGGSYLFPLVIAKNDCETDLALLRLEDLLPLLALWAEKGTTK